MKNVRALDTNRLTEMFPQIGMTNSVKVSAEERKLLEQEVLFGLAEAEKDLAAGRLIPMEQVFAELRDEFGL